MNLDNLHTQIQTLHSFLEDLDSNRIDSFRSEICKCMCSLRELLLFMKNMDQLKLDGENMQHHSRYSHHEVSALVRRYEQIKEDHQKMEELCKDLSMFN